MSLLGGNLYCATHFPPQGFAPSAAAPSLPPMCHVESCISFNLLISSFPRLNSPHYHFSWCHSFHFTPSMIIPVLTFSFSFKYMSMLQIRINTNKSKKKKHRKKKNLPSLALCHKITILVLSFCQPDLQKVINILCFHFLIIHSCKSRVMILAPHVKRTQHHQTLIQFNDFLLKIYPHLGTYSSLGPCSSAKFSVCSSPACAPSQPIL